ncbi:MAG: hypothetical protein AAGB51_06290 [Planctomycetota bacterium]
MPEANERMRLARLALESGKRWFGEALRLVRQGKRVDVWYAYRGAKRYVRAIAEGHVATPEQEREQLEACRTCPSRVDQQDRGATVWYCGEPWDDREDADPPTCGCPCEALAAVALKIKACPQGKGPQLTTDAP